MMRLDRGIRPATQGTDYSLTTDAVTRSTTITWLGSATTITYDMTVLFFEELFNRICQLVYNYFTIKINYWSLRSLNMNPQYLEFMYSPTKTAGSGSSFMTLDRRRAILGIAVSFAEEEEEEEEEEEDAEF